MNLQSFFQILLVVSIWGISFPVTKIGLSELPPFLFCAVRFSLVALPFVVFVPPPKVPFWKIVSIGLLIGTLKFGLLFVALGNEISAGMASIVLQAQVFITIGISAVVFAESVSQSRIFSMMMASVGFAVLLSGGGAINPLGFMLVVSAAAAWAFANIVLKSVPVDQMLSLMVWMSLVPLFPMYTLSYVLESNDPIGIIASLSWQGWAAALYMALISTITAYGLWGRLLSQYSAVVVAPFALLVPVVGIFFSGILLGERMDGREAFGVALVLLALAVSTLSDRWRRLLPLR